jgi:hypothetical protein
MKPRPSLCPPQLRPPATAFRPPRRVALIDSHPPSLVTQLSRLAMRSWQAADRLIWWRAAGGS